MANSRIQFEVSSLLFFAGYTNIKHADTCSSMIKLDNVDKCAHVLFS